MVTSVEKRIQKFNAENAPFYIMELENEKQYSLCLCFGITPYSKWEYCQEAFNEYAKEIGEPIKDKRGYYTHGTGEEWEAAFKKAFEGEKRLKKIDFDSERDGFYCYCNSLATLEDLGKRFKVLCENTEKFIPIVSVGIKEEIAREAAEEALMKTVRGQLMKYPNARFKIRNEMGDFTVGGQQVHFLLNGEMSTVESDFKEVEMSAEEFLNRQVVEKQQDLFDKDTIRIIAEEGQKEEMGIKMGGM